MGNKLKALAIAGAFSFALAGCVPQAVKGYEVGTISSAVVIKIVGLHKAGCDGKSAAARQKLIRLYRVFVNRDYPPGGVCNDPMSVLRFAVNKGSGHGTD